MGAAAANVQFCVNAGHDVVVGGTAVVVLVVIGMRFAADPVVVVLAGAHLADGGGGADGADVGELVERAAQAAAGDDATFVIGDLAGQEHVAASADASGVAALDDGVDDDFGVVALVKFFVAVAVGDHQHNAATAAVAPANFIGAVPDIGLGPVGVFGDVASLAGVDFFAGAEVVVAVDQLGCVQRQVTAGVDGGRGVEDAAGAAAGLVVAV